MNGALAGNTFVGRFGQPKHRGLRIDKVENGFTVCAQVTRKEKVRAEYVGGSETDIEVSDEKQYVFYTEAELLDFVKTYMAAPAADLRQ